jgi:hypothetical protein
VQSKFEALNGFCKLVNCQMTFLWGPKVQDFINNAPTPWAKFLTPGPYIGAKTDVQYYGYGLSEVKVKNDGSTTVADYTTGKLVGFNRPLSEMMDPQHNLITGALFACLPGIIYGLDKYRQIKCLYADCLQNAVGKEGLPVTACEDQKSYATCKYITSELFAVFPWTAVYDHFFGMIKRTLSNPFEALGAAIYLGCRKTCNTVVPETRLTLYGACETVKLLSQLGSVAQDVKSIIDEGFTIRTDYCKRLD